MTVVYTLIQLIVSALLGAWIGAWLNNFATWKVKDKVDAIDAILTDMFKMAELYKKHDNLNTRWNLLLTQEQQNQQREKYNEDFNNINNEYTPLIFSIRLRCEILLHSDTLKNTLYGALNDWIAIVSNQLNRKACQEEAAKYEETIKALIRDFLDLRAEITSVCYLINYHKKKPVSKSAKITLASIFGMLKKKLCR